MLLVQRSTPGVATRVPGRYPSQVGGVWHPACSSPARLQWRHLLPCSLFVVPLLVATPGSLAPPKNLGNMGWSPKLPVNIPVYDIAVNKLAVFRFLSDGCMGLLRLLLQPHPCCLLRLSTGPPACGYDGRVSRLKYFGAYSPLCSGIFEL